MDGMEIFSLASVVEENINPQMVQISGPTGDPQEDMGVEHQGSAGS